MESCIPTIYIREGDMVLQRHQFVEMFNKIGTNQQRIEWFEQVEGQEFNSIPKLKKAIQDHVRQSRVRDFVPPTIEEVATHFQAITGVGGVISLKFAEIFVSAYEAKNWTYGAAKTKLTDWKRAIAVNWDVKKHIIKYRHLEQEQLPTEERKRNFYAQLVAHFQNNPNLYSPILYRNFYNYWSETDEFGRLRYEFETIWELDNRLIHYAQQHEQRTNFGKSAGAKPANAISPEDFKRAIKNRGRG